MKVGTKVKWLSQGRGSSIIKHGEIVRLITADENPYKTAVKEYPNHRLMFGGFCLPGKNTNVAYFIEVIVGPQTKPRLYMPFPYQLMKD